MLLHAGFVVGLDLLHLRLLIGRQKLVHLTVDASLRDREFHLNLSPLRRQRANLCGVIGALDVLAKLLMIWCCFCMRGLIEGCSFSMMDFIPAF